MKSISFFYEYPSLIQCQKKTEETIPPLTREESNKLKKMTPLSLSLSLNEERGSGCNLIDFLTEKLHHNHHHSYLSITVFVSFLGRDKQRLECIIKGQTYPSQLSPPNFYYIYFIDNLFWIYTSASPLISLETAHLLFSCFFTSQTSPFLVFPFWNPT